VVRVWVDMASVFGDHERRERHERGAGNGDVGCRWWERNCGIWGAARAGRLLGDEAFVSRLEGVVSLLLCPGKRGRKAGFPRLP